MRTLSVDTSLGACQAAVLDGDRVLAAASEAMTRGHQERLAPLVQETLAASGLAFNDLERIGVVLGPGSFTGLRVGLAFAKGLGAALSLPVAGVGALEALAEGAPADVLAIIDANRGQAYVQAFRDGHALTEPHNRDVTDLEDLLGALSPTLTLVGPGTHLALPRRPDARVLERTVADPATIARLASTRPAGRLTPLYLRAPDAKPSAA